MRHRPGVGLMFGRCLRRRASITRTLVQRLEFLYRELRGFVMLKKNQKSGWVGQAPTRIIIFFEILYFFVLFVVFFFVEHVSKKIKNWIEEWVGGVWPIRVFLGFLDFF